MKLQHYERFEQLKVAAADFERARNLIRDCLFRCRYVANPKAGEIALIVADIYGRMEQALPRLDALSVRHRLACKTVPYGRFGQVGHLVQCIEKAAHGPPSDDADWSILYGEKQ